MNIVYIAAGAGGMYCGACTRDIALVRALSARGIDVQVLPLYTPLRRDGSELPATPRVFFGGINVYLQQLFPFFRHTPDAVDRLLDSPRLLRWISRFAIATDPAKLGEMTVSVLKGSDGLQRKEHQKLLEHLEKERPEIVIITNSLLSALAPDIKARLGIPVVCMLQGEEEFIDGLGEPYREQVIGLIRDHAAAIDRFLAPYQAYIPPMSAFLGVPRERIILVRPSIEIPPPAPPLQGEGFTVGYLNAISRNKGLDLLVSATKILAGQGRNIRLLIAGKPLNSDYWQSVRAQIIADNLVKQTEYLGEVDYAGKQAFLRRCHVFTVPSRIREARGMAFLEAQAAGVPVIAPATGIFPEMLALTGGGLLIHPDDAVALAEAIAWLQDHPAEARQIGETGRAGVARHYAASQSAGQMQEILNTLL